MGGSSATTTSRPLSRIAHRALALAISSGVNTSGAGELLSALPAGSTCGHSAGALVATSGTATVVAGAAIAGWAGAEVLNAGCANERFDACSGCDDLTAEGDTSAIKPIAASEPRATFQMRLCQAEPAIMRSFL